MSAASFLREAADRLEELAEKATPGPWRIGRKVSRTLYCTPQDNLIGMLDYGEDAALIATFGNPQVARAVADWLRDESHALLTGRISEPTAHAVAVAAAVLGRPAPEDGE